MEENNNSTNVNNNVNENNLNNNKKKGNVGIIILLILLILCIVAFAMYFLMSSKNNSNSDTNVSTTENNKYLEYRIKNNELQNFDLYFMKLDNSKINKVYSPLSIKYALQMLEDGANGDSKKQITNIIDKYTSKKYTNSKNLSVANGLFIKNNFKEFINDKYIITVKNKYDAEVLYDSFETPNVLNSWVDKKTFGLLKNVSNDISKYDFILTNALAIDMEWNKPIQSRTDIYNSTFKREKFEYEIYPLLDNYHKLKFGDLDYEVSSVEFGGVSNKYDIINILGEDNIRKTVIDEYNKWYDSLTNEEKTYIIKEKPNDVANLYIKDLKTYYNKFSSSTDFSYYVDDSVKVFVKDLKQYDGTTLQYVGIMPINDSLDNFIKNTKADKINSLLENVKEFNYDNCKDKVITHVYGYIPLFKFNYDLSLKDNLKTLGIKNVFDNTKADLSNLTSSKGSAISEVKHKTNIEFSNEGIKASAATIVGGLGSSGFGFDYKFDVPIEKIDLTFDKPFMFIIRDKETNESWFNGTVYEPIKYIKSIN